MMVVCWPIVDTTRNYTPGKFFATQNCSFWVFWERKTFCFTREVSGRSLVPTKQLFNRNQQMQDFKNPTIQILHVFQQIFESKCWKKIFLEAFSGLLTSFFVTFSENWSYRYIFLFYRKSPGRILSNGCIPMYDSLLVGGKSRDFVTILTERTFKSLFF